MRFAVALACVAAACFTGGYAAAPGHDELTDTAAEAVELSDGIETAFFACESGETSAIVTGGSGSVNPWPVQPECAGWSVLVHTHPSDGPTRLSAVDKRIPAEMDVEYICAVSLTGHTACGGDPDRGKD